MQEIIVYRNPLEAAVWHSIMSGDFAIIIMGAILALAFFLGSHRILERRVQYRNRGRLANILLAVSGVVWVAAIYLLI